MIKKVFKKILEHFRNWGELYFLALLFSMVLYWFIKATDKKPVVQPDYIPVTTVTKQGKTYSQYEVEELTKAQMRKFKDSLQLALKGQVKVITSTVVQIDTQFIEVPVSMDSNSFTVRKEDPYMSLIVEGNIKDSSADIFLFLLDTLNVAVIDHNPLIGRRTMNATVYNTNPYVIPTMGTGAILKERRNILSIGPYVGYDLVTQQPSIGVSIMVPVLTIKSRK